MEGGGGLFISLSFINFLVPSPRAGLMYVALRNTPLIGRRAHAGALVMSANLINGSIGQEQETPPKMTLESRESQNREGLVSDLGGME